MQHGVGRSACMHPPLGTRSNLLQMPQRTQGCGRLAVYADLHRLGIGIFAPFQSPSRTSERSGFAIAASQRTLPAVATMPCLAHPNACQLALAAVVLSGFGRLSASKYDRTSNSWKVVSTRSRQPRATIFRLNNLGIYTRGMSSASQTRDSRRRAAARGGQTGASCPTADLSGPPGRRFLL